MKNKSKEKEKLLLAFNKKNGPVEKPNKKEEPKKEEPYKHEPIKEDPEEEAPYKEEPFKEGPEKEEPYKRESDKDLMKPEIENRETDKDFPGYPHYPASEDIYNKEKETNLDPDDLSKVKNIDKNPGKRNEKDFSEDMTGEDLDVPGSEADEAKGKPGTEDEENNYYSIGGDNHEDLEEDNG